MNRTPIAALLAFLCCLAASAVAQVAPEGNAHPVESRVSDAGRAQTNPFGASRPWRAGRPAEESAAEIRAKSSLAAGVDLSPLRGLAVFHSGRVKVLDTLARETVRGVTGRGKYQDFLPGSAGEKTRVISYDPLFTLLDFVIDPAYYGDKPLVHVEYLTLRRELVELAFPGDPGAQERLLLATRVSPEILVRHLPGIIEERATSPAYRDAIDRIDAATSLFQLSAANMMLVVPEHRGEPYRHLAELGEATDIRIASLALGDAWRRGDPAGVNAAAKALADGLRALNPELYPSGALELTYNRLNAFEWGYWLYGVSFVALVIAFGTARKGAAIAGIVLLGVALAFHSTGFVMRCLIAERFAIQNQFESMTGLSLFAAIVGMAIMVVRRQWLFGAASAGVGFLVLIAATQTGIPGKDIEREAAILNTSWLLKYHVTTVLASYGLISLGCLVSLFYLGVHFFRRGDGGAMLDVGSGRERALQDLDKAQMVILQLAFWGLLVGILLGAWWADHSWGRFWAFDPKETWALITWIVYLVVIHVRFVVPRRGLVTALLSVLGFIVMLWTYFGVNLLLPGLHAYA